MTTPENLLSVYHFFPFKNKNKKQFQCLGVVHIHCSIKSSQRLREQERESEDYSQHMEEKTEAPRKFLQCPSSHTDSY